MIKQLRIFLFLLHICASLPSFGQSTTTLNESPQRVPPAPTTAALERYALMPVNEPSGTPAISIPLYNVQSGQLTLPVTVNYHASGVRVTDMASWVGLSWSLNAGGVITRIVRGGPDENPDSFRANRTLVPDYASIKYPLGIDSLERIAKNKIDFQPDLYTFNFLGQAGTFMLGNNSKTTFHMIPLQPILIEALDTAFQLIDAQGVQYFFGSKERIAFWPRPTPDKRYISSWYLDRIVSADLADTIRLEYERYALQTATTQQQQSVMASVSVYNNGGSMPDVFTETPIYTHQIALKLQRIIFKTGIVTLSATTGRLDAIGDKQLKTITVTSRNLQDTLKQFRFCQSYFIKQGPVSRPEDSYSLRLDSIQTVVRYLQEPPYRFRYNALPLTTRAGPRDHWGYYNGAPVISSPLGTSLLIPTTTINTLYGEQVFSGADRKPNPAYLQAGMLTTIIYPTGGQQQFTYEPNTLAERYQVPNPKVSLFFEIPLPDSGESSLPIKGDTTFQVPYLARATCRIGIPCSPSSNDRISSGTVTLTDLTTGKVLSPNNPSWTGTFNAPFVNGKEFIFLLSEDHTYKIAITERGACAPNIRITYEAASATYAMHNAVTGGVRLRQESIQTNVGIPSTIKRYYYNSPHSTLSSGYLINNRTPVYNKVQTYLKYYYPPTDSPGGKPPQLIESKQNVLFPNSLTDISGGDRIVGYQSVTVVDSSTTGIISGHVSSTYAAASDEGGGWFPPCPPISNSWHRDQLLVQRMYANSKMFNGIYYGDLLKKLENVYTSKDTIEIAGFSVSPDVNISTDLDIALSNGYKAYTWANTLQRTGWQYLSQTRNYRYAVGDSTSYQLTTTAYHYANDLHQQPTLVETTLSNGQSQQVRSRYVGDYGVAQVGLSSSAPARALQELWRRHALAQLVEQTTTRTTPTDTVVTQSNLNLSRILAPGVVEVAQQLRLQPANPLSWRSFQPAQLVAGQLRTDTHYEPQLFFDHYNAQRQLAQAHVLGGLPISYLWDAHAVQPLAKIINATVQQVAVTSFEPEADGSWGYDTQTGIGHHLAAGQGHTGQWAYRLDNNWPMSRDSIPAGNYQLSCWYQGATAPLVLGENGRTLGIFQPVGGTAQGIWQQGRVQLHFSEIQQIHLALPALALPVLVDDVVLQPSGAQITSYTYDSLRGMTSQTDPTGRTLFYEYDALGRLVRTRDEQGRVLSQQQYHYAN